MKLKAINPSQHKLAQAISLALLALAANQAQALSYTVSAPIPVDGALLNNAGQFIVDSTNGTFAAYNISTGTTGLRAQPPVVPGQSTPADYLVGWAFNDAGHVAGTAMDTVHDKWTATRWDTATGVGTPLNNLTDAFGNLAFGINNQDQVVGKAWNTTIGGGAYSPVYWDADGSVHNLGTLGGSQGQAWAINDTGTIVGSSFTTNDDADHATVWHNGSIIDLGTLTSSDNYSRAISINNAGQVVGFSGQSVDDPDAHAVLWNLDGTTAPIDLGLAQDDNINNIKLQINDAGTVITHTWDAGAGKLHSTVWNGGSFTDLNAASLTPEQIAAGWNLFALSINNQGVILASISVPGATSVQVALLTPTAVPVPGAVWLFSSALAGFVGMKRRKQGQGA